MIDVVGQIRTSRFLACLDQDHAACVRNVLFLESQDRRERREHGISVIGTAAAKEAVVLHDGRPWPGPFGPALHLRLFVEMAIEQDRVVRLSRYCDENKGRTLGQADNVEPRAWK